MSRGEFFNQHQSDHSADISRINQMLENLSPEDGDDLCNSLYRQTVDEWEACARSFTALFDRLNLFNMRELNLFDIILDKGEVETYIRVQKDQEGSYTTTELLRQNSQIVNYGPTEKLSDTYVYRFGPNDDYEATIKLRKDAPGGITLEGDDRRPKPKTRFETSVTIAALEGEVLPSIARSRAMLARLWNAIQKIESSPVE